MAVPKPPPPKAMAPPQSKSTAGRFTVSSGIKHGPQRIGIYGTAGIGKTSLVASLAEVGKRPLLIDLDQGSQWMDVERVEGIETWEALLMCLQDNASWQSYDTVVIDTITAAQDMATSWIVRNVRNDKGALVDRLEGFGWGKGFEFVLDEMSKLLGLLDGHIRNGRNVVNVMHSCTTSVPNPAGEDYLRHEPRLQQLASGKAPVRSRVVEWLDYLLFVGYDVAVGKDGTARGSGTRTIYTEELPWLLAKRRRQLSSQYAYHQGSIEVWNDIFAKE